MSRWTRENRKHFVYEFWAIDDECLYVGLTAQPAGRISTHAAKHWWAEVTRIEATAYPNRNLGAAAERDRIAQLEPTHNFNFTERAVGSRSGLGHGGVAWRANT